MPQYPIDKGKLPSASARPSSAGKGLAFLAPAVIPVLDAAPAAAPLVEGAVAADVASGGLLTPLVAGFVIGVGIGAVVLWALSEDDGASADPTGNVAPLRSDYKYTWVPCPDEGGGNGNFVYSGNAPTDATGLACGLGGIWNFPPNTIMNPASNGPFGWFIPSCIGGPSTCGYPDVLVYEQSATDPSFGYLRGLWDGEDVDDGSPGGPSILLEPYGPPDLKPGYYAPPKNWPQEEPELAPILQPGYPWPQRWDQAVGDPVTQPSVREPKPVVYNPVTTPFPVIFVTPGTQVIGHGVTITDTASDLDPETQPQPEPVTQPAPGEVDTPTQTRTKTKENKIHVSSPGFRPWWVAGNFLTESFDFIDAMYGALPQKRKERGANPYRKAELLWEHNDEMDWAQAFENYINNQLQDMQIGLMGQVVTRGQKAIREPIGGASTGLQTALRKSRENLDKGLEAGGQDRDAGNLPTPTVEFAHKNSVTLSWGDLVLDIKL